MRSKAGEKAWSWASRYRGAPRPQERLFLGRIWTGGKEWRYVLRLQGDILTVASDPLPKCSPCRPDEGPVGEGGVVDQQVVHKAYHIGWRSLLFSALGLKDQEQPA